MEMESGVTARRSPSLLREASSVKMMSALFLTRAVLIPLSRKIRSACLDRGFYSGSLTPFFRENPRSPVWTRMAAGRGMIWGASRTGADGAPQQRENRLKTVAEKVHLEIIAYVNTRHFPGKFRFEVIFANAEKTGT